MSSVNPYTEL